MPDSEERTYSISDIHIGDVWIPTESLLSRMPSTAGGHADITDVVDSRILYDFTFSSGHTNSIRAGFSDFIESFKPEGSNVFVSKIESDLKKMRKEL